MNAAPGQIPPPPPLQCEVGWRAPDGRPRWDRREVADAAPARAALSGFAAGSRIRTPTGSAAVETLAPGDVVSTHHGPAPLVWVGWALSAAPTILFRVAAGAFGPGRPATDVVLGSGAHVLIDSARCEPLVGSHMALAPVAALADGLRVITLWPPPGAGPHGIAFERQAVVLVDGLPVAAWHPASMPGAAAATGLAAAIPPLVASAFGRASLAYLSATEARDVRGL